MQEELKDLIRKGLNDGGGCSGAGFGAPAGLKFCRNLEGEEI